MLIKNGIEYFFDCFNRFEVIVVLLRKSSFEYESEITNLKMKWFFLPC
jgi:hypothetical protein